MTEPPPKKPRRWRRRLLIALAAMVLGGVGLRLAVHQVPGFGPWLADGLRSLFGNEAVAWLEDTVYGAEDWVNQKTRGGQAPEALWEVPSAQAAEAPPPPSASAAPAEPPFALAELGPVHESLATPGDGVWLPLRDPRRPDDRVRMLKTQLHPDKNRSWSVVAVVAVSLELADLHLVAGRYEPESRTPEAKDYQRPAVVPAEHRAALLAAFNGGYKSTHGDYGMRLDGVTLVPPRVLACTIAKQRDGSLLVRPWEKVRDGAADFVWLRQTPICMYDEGEPHPALSMASMGWGASSVSGTTVIRRSALGLDRERKVLFVGIGDHTTGETIARALHHAGAAYVAQLDVNFSYPKFLLYQQVAGSEELKPVPLTSKFEFAENQYVGGRAERDFFYLLRRE